MLPPLAANPMPSLPLAGRARELAWLRTALDEAGAGRGTTIFVGGEGGVGKTRLATALAEQAAERGWSVAAGRAYPVETGVPYALFADAFLPLLRQIEPGQLSLLTRGGLAELTQLFPALGVALDRAPAAARGDPAEQKARLLWTFAQLVARLAARRPLLVLLDNLQWADASSLELLHFVARQVGSERVLVVGSYNETQRDQQPALREAEQSLVGLGAARALRLEPLSPDDLHELVGRAFGIEGSAVAPFVERLWERTRGNPFFVTETLEALVASGRLHRRDGVWLGWEIEELGLPRTVRDTVLAGLARLSPDARRLADVAAVLGARLSHDTLAVVSGLADESLLAALDELRGARLLVEREAAGDAIAYDFAHPILRETLHGELGRARVRALHASIAESLERHYGGPDGGALAHADELAYHFARADARALAAKAVRYLERAGSAALARHADHEAADYLAAALAIAERTAPPSLDGASGDGDASGALDATLAESMPTLAAQLARVRQRLGDYDGALALWARARGAAARRGDSATEAEIARRMGLARFWTGRYAEAIASYDAGLAVADAVAGAALRARLLVARAMCRQAIGGRDAAEQDVREALALAERTGDVGLLARVHRALVLLYVWTGPPGEARRHGERAIELAAASGQEHVAWSAHWALAILGGLTGHSAEVAHHLEEAERLADELRSPLLRVWTAEVAIEYRAGIGEWDAAVALAEQTIATARALGQRTLLPRVLVWAALLAFGRGDLARGESYADEAWALSGAEREGDGAVEPGEVHLVVPAHIGRAAWHLTMERWSEAIEVGERGLRIAERSGYVVWAVHRLMPIVAEAALWAADHERARSIGRAMREAATRLGHPLGLAWADACVAVQEMLAGDKAHAVELLRDSCEALERIPFVPDAARLRRQLARALAETGDREGALAELRAAHEVFARLGAVRELAGTREQMRQLGGRPPVRASQPGVAGLTAREAEIVRQVARRRSNKEIGQALGISDRTVSTHLSNIFAKLGVASRGELTDLARENGLT